MDREVERLQARLDELKVRLARDIDAPDEVVAVLLAEIDATKDRLGGVGESEVPTEETG